MTSDKLIEKCIADEWLRSPHRREYKGVVFDPGKNIEGYYNLYEGLAVKPIEGDWSIMRDHIFKIICKGDERIFEWLMAWLARIVQSPGSERPGTCVVLMGEQGVGKGIFVREFGAIFGNHFIHLNNIDQLTGRFNGHLANKLLVFCDEALCDGNEKAAGIIKGLITEPTFPVEYKGKDIFHVKNHANFIIASNSTRVVPAGEKERRFCVLDVSSEKAGNIEYFDAIKNQMNNGGREAMLYDLLHLDISDVNLRIIPRTNALADQAILGLDNVPKFWLDCLTNPDNSLPIIEEGGNICILKSDLYKSYLDFSKKNGIKPILPNNSFGKTIRKYCPGIQDSRSSSEGRHPIYILPSSQECQTQFEKAIGVPGVFDDCNVS